ncbi:cob(I)yrinic acid a,c-diamide adenosyltransferase [Tunicatimonas pelagia]|uniref:cob(I)yrinic acid a,c-diamide adenosyltransferase n=1 Tax=Tunicatimonas pelagia TaxID=931531 RepID=UPI002665872F|nr:cob(I)yrinic acid a,c-diamide adenosyltransferase [Tunicatimonas pelagia]WKN42708.1 cob(I)yrinic acid a,c-diamide adenosyltransferase [Tunicatimonas pelagia]
MKIYTKTGDKGETSLYGGSRVSKADLRIEAIGTVDELNAQIGLLRDQPINASRQDKFQWIQDNLFVVGAIMASQVDQSSVPELSADSTSWLEREIDQMDSELAPMRFFILPGGHPVVSQAHVARCVCRRAERCVVRLSENDSVDPLLTTFLNRLSDYLFVLARYLGKELGVEEIPWKPNKP